jgi:hypothetical protein
MLVAIRGSSVVNGRNTTATVAYLSRDAARGKPAMGRQRPNTSRYPIIYLLVNPNTVEDNRNELILPTISQTLFLTGSVFTRFGTLFYDSIVGPNVASSLKHNLSRYSRRCTLEALHTVFAARDWDFT